MDKNKLTRRSKLTRPSSLFGKSLLGNKWSQIIHIFTAIFSLILSMGKLYDIYDDIKNGRYDNVLLKYERIMNFIVCLSISCISLNYIFNKSYYIEFINLHSKIANSDYFGLFCNSHLTKWMKINHLFFVSFISFEVPFEIVYFIHDYILLEGFTFSSTLHLLSLVLSFKVCFLYEFIFETCTYLQSDFILLDNLLVQLSTQTHQTNEINVKSLRLLHNEIIKCTGLINKLFKYAVLCTYAYQIGHNVCLIGILSLDQFNSYLAIFIIKFIEQSIMLTLITYHLVRVYQLSVQLFDKVYHLSFSLNPSHSITTTNEVSSTKSSVETFLLKILFFS